MPRQTVKQMLIDLYKEEREQERCALVHELKKEAEDFAAPYMKKIMELREKYSDLDRKMDGFRTEIRNEEEKRDKALKGEKLHSFTLKTCGDSLHGKLSNFDKETNNHIREILEGDKKEKKDE